MSDPRKTIEAALNMLLDTYEHDPRDPLITALKFLAEEPHDLGVGDLELVATIEPGGACAVHSRDGRMVKGVKAVACYMDNGQPVMQVTL